MMEQCKMNYDPMAIPGIVVKNHGPFAWGSSPANAVYNAVVMENVAEMDIKTLLLNSQAEMKQYVLDKEKTISTADPNYPSINSIIQSAVDQCKRETDGSDYQNK